MKLWFTSDWHLRHKNILTFLSQDDTPLRDFEDIDHMHDVIIDNINASVKAEDHLYNLGDVSMTRPKYCEHLFKRINCKHLRLVPGNHDIWSMTEYAPYFKKIHGIRVIDRIVFSHYPLHPSTVRAYKANVHGHVHANPSPEPARFKDPKNGQERVVPYINICVEATNYEPVSLDWIKAKIREAIDGSETERQ